MGDSVAEASIGGGLFRSSYGIEVFQISLFGCISGSEDLFVVRAGDGDGNGFEFVDLGCEIRWSLCVGGVVVKNGGSAETEAGQVVGAAWDGNEGGRRRWKPGGGSKGSVHRRDWR